MLGEGQSHQETRRIPSCSGPPMSLVPCDHSGTSAHLLEGRTPSCAASHPLLPPGPRADTTPSPSSTCGRALQAFKAPSGERRKAG